MLQPKNAGLGISITLFRRSPRYDRLSIGGTMPQRNGLSAAAAEAVVSTMYEPRGSARFVKSPIRGLFLASGGASFVAWQPIAYRHP
jgi:hypothetical protein